MFHSSADHHQGAYLILVKITYLKFQSSYVVNVVMRQHTVNRLGTLYVEIIKIFKM
jgi:hypothetical protein